MKWLTCEAKGHTMTELTPKQEPTNGLLTKDILKCIRDHKVPSKQLISAAYACVPAPIKVVV